jgi:outer membrane usher protein
VCAALLMPIRAAAQDAASSQASEARSGETGQRAFLAMSVNGVKLDDSLVVIRGDDVLVPAAALESAGLRAVGGRRETVDGAEFVSLRSLAPRVTFRIDEVDLQLTMTADPELLGVITRNLDPGAPPDMVFRSAPSAFLNYSATAGTDAGYELFTESGISAGGALLYTTATRDAHTVIRGLSNLTFDRRSNLQRWVIGDSFATGGPLGGDALLAGVSIGREFSIAPYFVRHPTMSLSTPVATPSVLEVHVNGRLVREEQVQPGRLDVRNLPMATGSNDTRLVLRDPFGGTREITAGFYLTTSVLARGVHDYQYSFGWRRESLGIASWDYREPVAIARHRIGLSDSITAGMRFEGGRDLVSGGPSVNLRLPVGELELAAAASRATSVWGTAGHASYMFVGRHISFGTLLAHSESSYTNVSLRHSEAHPQMTVSAFASIPTGRGSSLTVQHGETTNYGAATQTRSSLLGSIRLWGAADLVGSVTRNRSVDESGLEVSLGVTIGFGARTVASTSAVRARGVTQAAVDVQRPLPVGTGYGYQFRAEAGDHRLVSGLAQYQGDYGRYEVRRNSVGSTATTSVNVAGGIVAIGGGIHATRPVRNSYALVRVPGVEGVRTYSSNQEIGRTGRRGSLLVPDLLPYYGNQLAISDTDIPLDYEVPGVQQILAPPYRGGAVAVFPVRRTQRITGSIRLVMPEGEKQPSYGTLTVTAGGETFTSPLGADGEFYFENVKPGRHAAEVAQGEATCRLTIEFPSVDEPTVTLGVLQCSVSAAR